MKKNASELAIRNVSQFWGAGMLGLVNNKRKSELFRTMLCKVSANADDEESNLIGFRFLQLVKIRMFKMMIMMVGGEANEPSNTK